MMQRLASKTNGPRTIIARGPFVILFLAFCKDEDLGDYPQVHRGYSKLRLVKRQERFSADLPYGHNVTNFRGLALKKSAPISEIRG